MPGGPWRSLHPAERRILEHLLRKDFAGRDAPRTQLDGCGARAIDAEGSLELRPRGGTCAEGVPRIAVDARYHDGAAAEDVFVNLLLHVVAGRLNELEFYKDDGSPIALRADAAGTDRIVAY